jgi:hypothetical protein
MKLAASIFVGMLMLRLLYAQNSPPDKAAEFAGRWLAPIPRTVIGTGAFQSLLIEKFGNKFQLTIIKGNRRTVGVSPEATHIFQTTTTETGPYILSRDGDRFIYRDETKQTNYLTIVIDKTQTNLNDGTYHYYWAGPKLP